MHAIDLTNTALLLGSALIIAGILSSLIATRFGAPMLLVFLGVGMLAGEDGPGGIVFSDYGFSNLIGSLALAIILFDGGLRTRFAVLRSVLRPAMLLASAGVLITAGLTGAMAFFVLHLDVARSFLLGAIVAPTDAAAVFFLLRNGGIELRPRMTALLEVESGTNDPVAVFLTFSTIAFIAAGGAMGPLDIGKSLIEQAGIGTVIGVAGGIGIVTALNRLSLPTGLHPLLAIAGAVLVYAGAAVLGGSGFLAAYLAGLIAGNRPVRAYASIVSLNDAATWLAQIVMFVVLGLLVTPHLLLPYALPALAIALFLIFVARPAAVWLCLAPFGFRWRENAFTSWAGMRGAVSIFLAAVPLLSNLDNAHLYFDVAFFVVVVSLLLQGWTTRWAALRLHQALPRQTLPVQRVEIDLPGQHDVEIVGYPILADSRILNVSSTPGWMRMALVVRDKKVFEPSEAGKLQVGDYAYVLAPTMQVARLDALFAPLAERPEKLGTEWEFAIHGDAPLSDLNALYDLKLAPELQGMTVAELFADRLDRTPEPGDSLPLGGSLMSVTQTGETAVTEVMLRFIDESLPSGRVDRVRKGMRDVIDTIAKN